MRLTKECFIPTLKNPVRCGPLGRLVDFYSFGYFSVLFLHN